MPKPPTKDLPAFKRTYRKTNNIRTSALAAGYSESVAKKGISDLPASIQRFVLRHNRSVQKYEALSRSLDAEQQEHLTRGCLISNAVSGKDRATQSLKLLGQDRRVSMWATENQTGIINMIVPSDLVKMIKSSEVKQLDGSNQA